MERLRYPSYVTDEEWAILTAYTPALAKEWAVGTSQPSAKRTSTRAEGTEAPTECRHYRQPKRENDGKRGERLADGAKKVNGRKRHALVDINGLLLKAKVHAVNATENVGE